MKTDFKQYLGKRHIHNLFISSEPSFGATVIAYELVIHSLRSEDPPTGRDYNRIGVIRHRL